MAVADTPESRARLAALGWRIAGAFFRRREASIFLVVVGLSVYFSVRSSAFYEGDNVRNIAQLAAPLAIIAIGEVMLLICGEIDLSAGRVYALAPMIMYEVSDAAELGLPIWVGVAAGLLVAGLVGTLNGVITVFLRVPSFITTLGTLFLVGGITLHISRGFQVLTPGGETFDGILAHPQPLGGIPLVGDIPKISDLPADFLWALGLVAVFHLLLTRTRWGLYTIATGGNLVGASESGVNVRAVKIGNFVMCSMLAGFAGILTSVRIDSILPLQGGEPLMFQAVAAAVIGGTSLFGGLGTITGGFLGVLVVAILNDGFTLVGVSAFTFNIILGAAILVSMTLNVYLARLRTAGRLQR